MQMIVDRPGYFGRKRPKKIELYDNLYGEGHWSECWQVNGRILSFRKAVDLYDESYYIFLSHQPETVDWITSFGECYDSDPSNVQCGLVHDQQSVPRHIQDISVRRALKRLGVWFKGASDNLLWIRGEDSNGFCLNPGNVPFAFPELLLPETEGGPIPQWASPTSVEAFWQRNKIIVIE